MLRACLSALHALLFPFQKKTPSFASFLQIEGLTQQVVALQRTIKDNDDHLAKLRKVRSLTFLPKHQTCIQC